MSSVRQKDFRKGVFDLGYAHYKNVKRNKREDESMSAPGEAGIRSSFHKRRRTRARQS